jgi:uncharacterized protein YxjI
MPLIVTVNTTDECLRADGNILGDNKKCTIGSHITYKVYAETFKNTQIFKG